MSPTTPVTVSSPPFDGVRDFDLVVHDGRTLVVATPDRDHRACVWDPAADEWTQFRLDSPSPDDADYTEIYSMGAAVVDGRIVIGGGGDHQGFALWDLETGKVRLDAEEGGVASAARADFGGRSLIVVGGSSHTDVQLWDPAVDDGDKERPDRPSPYDFHVEIGDLFAQSYAGSAIGAGMLYGRPVVVATAHDGGVLVWDIDQQRPLVEFDDLGNGLFDFNITNVDGCELVVASGGQNLMLGDPETGRWSDPLTVPGGDVSCLDAGTVSG
ncbi:MAG: hypothetical protein ACRD0P_17385, partial [Stackebrandtia sp.]